MGLVDLTVPRMLARNCSSVWEMKFVYVRGYESVCVQVHICACPCGGQRTILDVSLGTTYLFFLF